MRGTKLGRWELNYRNQLWGPGELYITKKTMGTNCGETKAKGTRLWPKTNCAPNFKFLNI